MRNKIFPRQVKVHLESDTAFICNSFIKNTWFHKSINKLGTRVTKVSNEIALILQKITLKDAGTYLCHGTYYGGYRHFFDEAELIVYGKHCYGLSNKVFFLILSCYR